jgi:inner membrane protein
MAGWALGQAGLKTKTRKGMAALILGANMPDIDVFFGWAPWLPLATHRGFTHGLVGGVLLMPPLLAGFLWLLDRWQVGRGATFKSHVRIRFGWLVALAYFGAITHPLLDLLTTYSVQLYSPLSKAWYHSDGLFIIDLWLWLILGGTLIWSHRLEAAGKTWRRPVQVAIGVVLAYIGINLLITQSAFATVRSSNPQAQSIFASPPPVTFWRRQLTWREGDCYRSKTYDPLSGAGATGACIPHNMHDPQVVAARRADPGLRKFLRWSILPMARVQGNKCQVQVVVGDFRYGSGASSRLRHETILPRTAPGC